MTNNNHIEKTTTAPALTVTLNAKAETALADLKASGVDVKVWRLKGYPVEQQGNFRQTAEEPDCLKPLAFSISLPNGMSVGGFTYADLWDGSLEKGLKRRGAFPEDCELRVALKRLRVYLYWFPIDNNTPEIEVDDREDVAEEVYSRVVKHARANITAADIGQCSNSKTEVFTKYVDGKHTLHVTGDILRQVMAQVSGEFKELTILDVLEHARKVELGSSKNKSLPMTIKNPDEGTCGKKRFYRFIITKELFDDFQQRADAQKKGGAA